MRVAAALAFGLAALNSRGDVVTLKPVADTSLFERHPNNNLGKSWLAAGTLNSGDDARALIQFDLTSVPGNAVVSSVAVNVRVVKSPSGGGFGSTFEVRRVLQSWSEGAKGALGVNTGGPTAAGESSWNSRGPGNWAVAGGLNGTDFAAAASATRALSGNALAFASSAGLVADVQGWLQDPAANFGWVLISQLEGTPKTARRFGSRETVNNEPTLTIEYTVTAQPLPPTLVGPSKIGDKFQFQFAAEASHAYTVEASADLIAGPWQVVTNYPAAATAQTFTLEDLIQGAGRYYRVRSP